MNREAQTHNKYQRRIFTIPNILSLVRIVLIPVIIWQYCVEKRYATAGLVLIVSGFTDMIDGFIARRFQMISNLGKILDPIADKLTQATMLICLALRYPLMLLTFILMVIKESYMTISGFYVIKKTGIVFGADWHGKLATIYLFVMMLMHIFWTDIPEMASYISILLCDFMIIISFVLYVIRNTRAIKSVE